MLLLVVEIYVTISINNTKLGDYMNNQIILDKKLVGKIRGDFEIPTYQRGYRWTEVEVERLLDDIYENGSKPYCLQPIVLCKNGEKYEVIDGQQRLTTIFLIYVYLNKASGGFLDGPKFSINYVNRPQSAEFLRTLDKEREEEYIDFWFMRKAYDTIQKWFEGKDNKSSLTNINKFFDENVEVIWYEVGTNENANQLFSRLNIGKIPLTSAELVKAMFLSSDNPNITREKQEEIALQWDNIEHELNNESLWYFLTNSDGSKYQTKIDLVLDLISQKPSNTREKYYTFFYFDSLKNDNNLINIWQDIQHIFLMLKDWYSNHEFYHNIGYLIMSKYRNLIGIYNMSKDKTKSDFITELRLCIKQSVNISDNYADLSYDNSSDYAKITRLLQLFNVESVRQNGAQTQWFPFDKFKMNNGAMSEWTLEHIHARNSQGLNRQEDWREWLKLHIESLHSLRLDDNDLNKLIEEMNSQISRTTIDKSKYEDIVRRTCEYLSSDNDVDYINTISNLALLNRSDNAALSNSTFDVKRNEIIKLDKEGRYIPYCTKMVFLKYYTPSEDNQLHFWGQKDREAYIASINKVLENYIEPINIRKGGERDVDEAI
jgi:uncharacterized protein with ParB-like and HNH nuclease domain